MEKQNYYCSITAKISARDTFKCICKVTEWWSKNIEGKSKKLNDVFTYYSRESRVTFKITECIPDKKIVWHVTDGYLPSFKDKSERKNTNVVFEIIENGNSTQINFTHIGLVPEIECYKACVIGWNQYFKDSLLKLLTTGKGEPAQIKFWETLNSN
ncbi:MAG: SRPBCC domain-containing protein [Ginsengibacter sp.]